MDTKKLLLFIALLLLSAKAYVQVQECEKYPIPPEHLGGQTIEQVSSEWGSTGAQLSQINTPADRQYDVTDFGILPDMQPCGTEINNLTSKLEISATNPAMLYFPPGAYLIDKPLLLEGGVILKGAGGDGKLPEQTHFHFNLGADYAHPCIEIKGYNNGVEDIFITDDTKFQSISVTQIPLYFIGGTLTYGVVGATNMYTVVSGTCIGNGQISGNTGVFFCSANLVAGKPYNVTTNFSNNYETVTVTHTAYLLGENENSDSLFSDYLANTAETVINDSILSKAPVEYYQNTLSISGSYNWIRGVESNNTRRFHVEITGESNTVSGCYFHHSVDYSDNSGRGYGVDVKGSGSYNRIENNIFYHLRHAMVLEGDPYKNVFGYNYSKEIYATGGNPFEPAADLLLHGRPNNSYLTGPRLNLLEGNYVERARVDYVDKPNKLPNGPYNTFFRCFSLNPFHVQGVDYGYQSGQYAQNIIGDRFWPTSGTKKRIKKKGFFDYWDEYPGYWEIPDKFCSFYWDSKPDFYYETLPWPLVPWEFQNPAAIRYNSNSVNTVFTGWDDYKFLCGPPNIKINNENWSDKTQTFTAMKNIVLDNLNIMENNDITFLSGEKLTILSGCVFSGNNNHVLMTSGSPCVPVKNDLLISLSDSTITFNEKSTGITQISFPEIRKNKNTKEVMIYPNPNNGVFYIDSGMPVEKITVSSILGKEISAEMKKDGELYKVIITGNYKGIVLVSIITDGSYKFFKLVIN